MQFLYLEEKNATFYCTAAAVFALSVFFLPSANVNSNLNVQSAQCKAKKNSTPIPQTIKYCYSLHYDLLAFFIRFASVITARSRHTHTHTNTPADRHNCNWCRIEVNKQDSISPDFSLTNNFFAKCRRNKN